MMRRFIAAFLAACIAWAPVESLAVNKSPGGAPGLTNAASVSITGGTESGVAFSQTLLNSNVRTVIQQGGVNLVAPGSFTMGNNGAITLGTATNSVFTNAYIYMLAGDIAAGVPAAAGWYYCQFTTTTAGTVFNNLWNGLGAAPFIASPTAFVTTGPGARTGDIAAEIAVQTTIPVLAANSQILASYSVINSNNANAKTYTVKLGATTFHTVTGTSVGRASGVFAIANIGATNKQVARYDFLSGFTVSTQEGMGTIDTTATSTLSLTIQRATATDNIVIQPPFIEVAL